MRRKTLTGFGVLLVVLLIAYGVFVIAMGPQFAEQTRVRNMPINDIALSRVADGVYQGDFTYGKFTYMLEVVVRDHVIEDIQILANREESKYAKKAEVVVERVLQAQSLEVDAVSGATTTSKALLKAMERALSKGILE